MINHAYKNRSIIIVDEPTYAFGSADNIFQYSKHYFGNDGKEYPTSKHGIKVVYDNEPINDCIVIGSGGATGVHSSGSLIDGDQLLLCCCNTLFCLSLPNLELKWKTQVDIATCFQLLKLEDDYLVHGEMQITRINRVGNIKWQFGGSDIFVSINDKEEFQLKADHISLSDFGNIEYRIDFNGNLISKKIAKE